MKKVFLAVTALLISTYMYAQTDTSTKKMFPPDINKTRDGMDNNLNNNKPIQNSKDSVGSLDQAKTYPDGILKKDGKMWLIKDNKMNLLDHSLTMNNGIKVSEDGSYFLPNGSKMTLNEGELMDMSGKIIPMMEKHKSN